jgi:hypothetical protein
MSVRNINISSGAPNDGTDISDNDDTRQMKGRIRFPSIPRELDIFGFYLSPKHALITLLIIIVMMGPFGGAFH